MILHSVIHTAFAGCWQQSWGEWKWGVKEAGKAENVTICSSYPILLFVCVAAQSSFNPPTPLCAPTSRIALAGEAEA